MSNREARRTMSANRRPRVLFAIHGMDGGGAERQMIEILRHVDRRLLQPMLYLQSATGELMQQIPDDVPVASFWQRHPDFRRSLTGPVSWAQSRDLKQFLQEQNIAVVYHRCYLMNLMAAPACRKAGVPQIASTVADPEAELKMHSKVGTLVSWWYARRCYQMADVVLANSQGLRDRNLEYFRLAPSRVRTIYNLFDIQRIDQLASEPGPHWDPNQFHLISIGRLDHRKGQHLLIKALSILKGRHPNLPFQLHLVGQGPDEGLLRQMAMDHGVEQQVHFHGFQLNPLPWLKAADLFCLSSLNEGMPNALVEAAICRIPTVSTDCPSGPGEILLHKLVPVDDPEKLAVAIHYRYKNPVSQAMLEKQRQHVIDRFSWQIGIEQLQTLLLELSGRSGITDS